MSATITNPVVAKAKAKAEEAKAKQAEAKQDATPKQQAPKVTYGPQPIGRRAKKRNLPCGCGCGEMTGRAFAPGHDGRLSGWFRRLTEDLTLEQLPKAAQDVYHAWVKAGKPGGIEHPQLRQVVMDMRAAAKK